MESKRRRRAAEERRRTLLSAVRDRFSQRAASRPAKPSRRRKPA